MQLKTFSIFITLFKGQLTEFGDNANVDNHDRKNFMVPFYGWGSTAPRLLRGGSLLFTTKFPEISDTHFTDLGMMKG